VLIVFGERPKAIKTARLVKEFQKYQEHFKDKSFLLTLQNREILDQALYLFEIILDYDLNIMEPEV
jgi:UDP-N-acetylglucosamine 2-epimerase